VYDFLLADNPEYGCGWAYATMEQAIDSNTDINDCFHPPSELRGLQCLSLVGSLTLILTQPLESSGISAPRLGEYLQLLGLNKLIQIEGEVNILNAGTLATPRLPFSDVVFLPNLRRAFSLRLNDANPSMGVSSMFSRLGGFANLEEVEYLQIVSQSLADLTSFQGLKCINRAMSIEKNTVMTSLNGLENVLRVGASPYSMGAPLLVRDNPALASLSALAQAAGCKGDGSGSDQGQTISLSIQQCRVPIVSWSGLCSHLRNGTCR
jgi:hypothetical protein